LYTNDQNINPQKNNYSINDYYNQYELFFSKFKNQKNSFYINSDSGLVLADLAETDGLNAAICYNGDILYAAMGADLDGVEPYNSSNFHFVKPNNTLVALDCLVINKNIEDLNNQKQKDVYDVAYKVCLEGANLSEQKISETNSQDEYTYGPMINFDYVLYTSPLKNINQYALDDSENGYFGNDSDGIGDLLRSIYMIDLTGLDISKIMEQPIDNLSKSNMN